MAKVTIHVSAFDYEWEGEAESEGDVFDQLTDRKETRELARLAFDNAKIDEATYDKPEPEDTSETEVEDEESD